MAVSNGEVCVSSLTRPWSEWFNQFIIRTLHIHLRAEADEEHANFISSWDVHLFIYLEDYKSNRIHIWLVIWTKLIVYVLYFVCVCVCVCVF